MDDNFNNGYNNTQENNSQDYNQQYNQQYGQQNNQYYNQPNGYQEQNNQYGGYNVQPYDYQQNYQEQYNQPYQYNDPYMNGQNYNEDGSRGFGIASMVLGICSVVCCLLSCLCCFVYLAVPTAIVGLILGIVSIKKGENAKGMAIAGIITSTLGLVVSVVIIIAVFVFLANSPSTYYGSYPNFSYFDEFGYAH